MMDVVIVMDVVGVTGVIGFVDDGCGESDV